MTRWKKEIRKKGFQLEIDYPWLPYGNPALESVRAGVVENEIILQEFYVVGTITRHINKSLQEDYSKQTFD